MNRNQQYRWPGWLIFTMAASALVFGSFVFTVLQMIATERSCQRSLIQLQAEAKQYQTQDPDSRFELKKTRLSKNWSDSDRQRISDWQDIAVQFNSPYMRDQLDRFMQRVANGNSLVAWQEFPAQLARFIESNRMLIDAIYRQFPEGQEAPAPALQDTSRSGLWYPIRTLVFLDAATCLESHDQYQFHRAIRNLHEINRSFLGHPNLSDFEPLFYLLHHAIDKGLLSNQQASDWTEQLCRELFLSENTANRSFRPSLAMVASMHHWNETPASIQLALLENEERSLNAKQLFYVPATNLAMLAMRVAVLNHMQQHRALPDSLAELKATQLVQEVEKTIAPVRKHDLFSIEYKKRNETEAIIQLNSKGPLSGTSYPVQETYAIKLTNP
jgi:hypothetical protein